ncbi:MAG: PAS domain-containing protein, partial [Bradyrhizobium sp.]|nr:PAS domain-containing protein [Bradyrhizobium sp.]
MAGKNWQASSRNAFPARVVAAAMAVMAALEAASPACAWAAPADFSPSSFVGVVEPDVLWKVLIAGIVVCAFLASVVIWIHSSLRRTKRAQLRRNAFVSSALNNLSQGLMLTDSANRVVFYNRRFLEIYGMTRADIPPGCTGRDLVELRRQRGLLALSVEDYARKAREPDGCLTDLPDGRAVRAKIFRLPTGGSIGIHEDCTVQRRLEDELASTKQFLESVVDQVPACVVAKNIEDGRYIFANRAFERFARVSRDRIIGKRPGDLFGEETAANITQADRAAMLAPGTTYRSELVVQRGDEKRILESHRVVARNDKNEPQFLIALFDDATERRSLSQELESTKKFLELIVDNIPVSLIVESAGDGRYLLANRSAEIILNRKREDATGLTTADIFNP